MRPLLFFVLSLAAAISAAAQTPIKTVVSTAGFTAMASSPTDAHKRVVKVVILGLYGDATVESPNPSRMAKRPPIKTGVLDYSVPASPQRDLHLIEIPAALAPETGGK